MRHSNNFGGNLERQDENSHQDEWDLHLLEVGGHIHFGRIDKGLPIHCDETSVDQCKRPRDAEQNMRRLIVKVLSSIDWINAKYNLAKVIQSDFATRSRR